MAASAYGVVVLRGGLADERWGVGAPGCAGVRAKGGVKGGAGPHWRFGAPGCAGARAKGVVKGGVGVPGGGIGRRAAPARGEGGREKRRGATLAVWGAGLRRRGAKEVVNGGGGEAAAAPGARLGGCVWRHGLWRGCYAGRDWG
jgi:hypothetical protein